MSLRKKTLIIIGLTLVGLVGSLYITSQMVLLRSFANLEEQHIRQPVERAVSAVFEELSILDSTVSDWAAWDDTYVFIEDGNEDYIQSNLVDGTFTTLRLNLMLFINSSGQVVFGKGFDLDNEEEIPVPQSLQEHLSDKAPLLRHIDTGSSITGIVLLPEGPLLVASRPILTSLDEGPIRGTLIMGRYLDYAEIERLGEITHLSLTVHRFNDPQMPPDFLAARSSLSEEAPIFVRPLSEESIAGYGLLKDIYGNPALLLRADMPREFYKQGQASTSFFMLSLLVVGLVFGVATMLLLEKQVLSRLARLSRSVSSIGVGGNFSARVAMSGRDELSSLADAINTMLEQVEQSGEALRGSEERFRDIATNMSDWVWEIDRQGVYTYSNPQVAQILGYSPGEVVGKNSLDFMHPDDRLALQSLFEEMIKEKKGAHALLNRHIHRDGSVRYLETNQIPLLDEEGNLIGFRGVDRDVTERKQAEEETQRNYDIQTTLNALLHTSLLDISLEDQLERVLDHILSIPWLALESRGGIFLVEDEPEVLVMKAQRGLATPLQTACARLPFGQCLCGRAALTREMQFADCINDRHETRYEGIVPHGHYCVPILFAGKVLGVINMYVKEGHRRDQREEEFLTAVANTLAGMIKRKQAEEALAEERNLLRTLIDNLPDYIYIKDTQSRYVLTNTTYAHFLGAKTPDEVVGKTVFDFFPQELARRYHADDQAVIQTGQPLFRREEPTVDRAGNRRWDLTAKVPLRDGQGKIVGLVGIGQDITERKQAEEEIRRRNQELSTLYQVSLEMAAQLDLNALLKTILLRAIELLKANDGGLYLYHPERQELELIVHQGLGQDYTGTRMALGEGTCGKVAQSGEPLLVIDYANWEGKSPQFADEPSFNALAVPIKRGETLLGVLVVDDPDVESRFEEGDIRLATLFANQAAIAIENARLYHAQQQKSTQLARILEVGNALRLNLELDQLLEKIAQAVRESMGFNLVVVHVTSEDGQSSVLRALAGYPLEARQRLLGIAMPMSILKPFLQERFKISRSYFISHEYGLLDESVKEFTYVPEPEELSPGLWHPEDVLLIPLETKEGKSVGLLSVDAPLDGRIPSLETIQTLEIFANQAAIAIENARLYDETQKRLAETTLLHKVAEVINASLDLPEVLQRVAEELSRTFGYPLLGVYLLEGEKLRLGAQIGYDPQKEEEIISLERGIVGRVARIGQPVFLHDVSQDPDYIPDNQETTGEICVPIKWGGEVLGVLNLESTSQRPLTEDDYQLLLTLSSHIGVAIENARLYEETKTLSITDGLTGLYNLRYFYEALEKEIARSERYSRPLSLIILDIDGFKRYNDTYGHLAGDDLLKELARLMQKTTRNTDIVARYGGEEFAIILPETGMEGAASLAQRIWEAVRGHPFKMRQIRTVARLTVSLGLATCPEHGKSANELVKAADTALLRAKRAGKDRVYSYSEESA